MPHCYNRTHLPGSFSASSSGGQSTIDSFATWMGYSYWCFIWLHIHLPWIVGNRLLFMELYSCYITERPEYDGGSIVTQYEVNMINPDGSTRIVFSGFETECLVASLLPGRTYAFQVRASNRIGVSCLWSNPVLKWLLQQSLLGKRNKKSNFLFCCVSFNSLVRILRRWKSKVVPVLPVLLTSQRFPIDRLIRFLLCGMNRATTDLLSPSTGWRWHIIPGWLKARVPVRWTKPTPELPTVQLVVWKIRSIWNSWLSRLATVGRPNSMKLKGCIHGPLITFEFRWFRKHFYMNICLSFVF